MSETQHVVSMGEIMNVYYSLSQQTKETLEKKQA